MQKTKVQVLREAHATLESLHRKCRSKVRLEPHCLQSASSNINNYVLYVDMDVEKLNLQLFRTWNQAKKSKIQDVKQHSRETCSTAGYNFLKSSETEMNFLTTPSLSQKCN